MIKFIAAVVFILGITACHEARACMPLLPYELRMQEPATRNVFSKMTSLRNPQAQELTDKLVDYTGVDPVIGVERIDIWLDEKDDSVMVYPLQRLTPNDDLVSCKVFVMPTKTFMEALKGKGQDT
ncbi:MAG: hypothetical protein EOQ39_18920 [Mesorhizobium sp.]|uniref:hypothetical protein n=1 Tax=Mesorhizobium sp. TaxID=1871066 RepID=UPI000FE920D0|nr:hypothetical protein [Mesorhizobium sp.]RWB08754.1 MAG: hypothetical protein EOQ37_04415 [Mesorhizobium sp.]RWB13594.1 MAG: hypothetical protein EOQ39_18920 [Mesorhizobium sp.]